VSVKDSSIQTALDASKPKAIGCGRCGKTVYFVDGLDAFKCWLCGGTVKVK
jgi:ribosomal protein S27AE